MGRKKGQRLTRGEILSVAMQAVDDEGLSGLSVRKLGARLGVQGMALYYHFTSKTAIIDSLVAECLSDVDLAADEADWCARLHRIHASQRSALLAHPNLLPAVISRPFNTPQAVRVTDVVLQVLLEAGFEDRDALHACQTLRAYVIGFTVTETVGMLGDPPRWDNRDRMSLQDYVEHGFNHLLQVAPASVLIDHDEEFVVGLSAVINGLRSRPRPVSIQHEGVPGTPAAAIEHDRESVRSGI
jgi:AcrR family transcriptional regulator